MLIVVGIGWDLIAFTRTLRPINATSVAHKNKKLSLLETHYTLHDGHKTTSRTRSH